MERTISFQVNTYNSIRCHNSNIHQKVFHAEHLPYRKNDTRLFYKNDSDFTKYGKNITNDVVGWNFIKKKCREFFRKHSVLIFFFFFFNIESNLDSNHIL